MAVRNSLMNAGNPILNAFAMERVQPGERALLAGTMSLLWSLGWVIAGPFYSVLQATLGFDLGYTVNFIVIIVLYSTATSLYWLWFRHAEADDAAAAGGVTAARPSPTPARGPGPAPRPDARGAPARRAERPGRTVPGRHGDRSSEHLVGGCGRWRLGAHRAPTTCDQLPSRP
jgi:MFS family permease